LPNKFHDGNMRQHLHVLQPAQYIEQLYM